MIPAPRHVFALVTPGWQNIEVVDLDNPDRRLDAVLEVDCDAGKVLRLARGPDGRFLRGPGSFVEEQITGRFETRWREWVRDGV